jgi:hypothetical protein
MKSFPLLWMAFLIYDTFDLTAKSAKIYAKSAKFNFKLCGFFDFACVIYLKRGALCYSFANLCGFNFANFAVK